MGFFSSFISGAVSFVKSAWNSVIKPLGSAIIGSVVSKIAEWIGCTDELKKAPSYKEEEATMDETFKVSELLEKQRENFASSISILENEVFNNTKLTLENLLELSEELNNNFDTSINTLYLKKQFNNFLNKVKKSLSEKVTQRIQISDPECSKLLRLDGNEREIKIENYIKQIINSGIEEYMSDLREKTNEMIEVVEFSIQEKFKQKKKEIELLIRDIENAQFQENFEEKQKKKECLLEKEKELKKYLIFLNIIPLDNNEKNLFI